MKWTRLDHEMPSESGWYLVHDESGAVDTAYFSYVMNEFYWYCVGNLVHWLSFPPPPTSPKEVE